MKHDKVSAINVGFDWSVHDVKVEISQQPHPTISNHPHPPILVLIKNCTETFLRGICVECEGAVEIGACQPWGLGHLVEKLFKDLLMLYTSLYRGSGGLLVAFRFPSWRLRLRCVRL